MLLAPPITSSSSSAIFSCFNGDPPILALPELVRLLPEDADPNLRPVALVGVMLLLLAAEELRARFFGPRLTIGRRPRPGLDEEVAVVCPSAMERSFWIRWEMALGVVSGDGFISVVFLSSVKLPNRLIVKDEILKIDLNKRGSGG